MPKRRKKKVMKEWLKEKRGSHMALVWNIS